MSRDAAARMIRDLNLKVQHKAAELIACKNELATSRHQSTEITAASRRQRIDSEHEDS
jgi:hypothetical protein